GCYPCRPRDGRVAEHRARRYADRPGGGAVTSRGTNLAPHPSHAGGRDVMRTLLATALLGLLVVAAPLSQERDQASNSLTRAFRSGGRIVIDLSAGEYRLVGTAADAITVTWSTRDRDRL